MDVRWMCEQKKLMFGLFVAFIWRLRLGSPFHLHTKQTPHATDDRFQRNVIDMKIVSVSTDYVFSAQQTRSKKFPFFLSQ